MSQQRKRIRANLTQGHDGLMLIYVALVSFVLYHTVLMGWNHARTVGVHGCFPNINRVEI